MSENNRFSDDEKPPRKGGEFRVPPRTWLVWIAIFGGIILLMLFRDKMDSQGENISQYHFLQLVHSNLIAQAVINYSPQNPSLTEITGKYYRTERPENGTHPKSIKAEQDDLVSFRTKARL